MHFLRQHYLHQVLGYDLSRMAPLSFFDNAKVMLIFKFAKFFFEKFYFFKKVGRKIVLTKYPKYAIKISKDEGFLLSFFRKKKIDNQIIRKIMKKNMKKIKIYLRI